MLKEIHLHFSEYIDNYFWTKLIFLCRWTSKSLSYCISILTKAENIDAAFTVLQKLDEIKDEVLDQAE